MVWKIKCECNERYSADIDSWKLFLEVRGFLEKGLADGVFKDATVIKPLDFGKNEVGEQIWHYTQRLFVCRVCGCLWALRYPDFPAHGYVGKYPEGKLDKQDWDQGIR